jgi:hypothetical protein
MISKEGPVKEDTSSIKEKYKKIELIWINFTYPFSE